MWYHKHDNYSSLKANMQHLYEIRIVGRTDGSGLYGRSTYGGDAAANSPANTGVLTNTGFDIILAITIAASLIFAALVIRFWKRSKKSASS